MSVDLAQIEAGLEALSGIDFASALTAFRSANFTGELTAAEDVASVVAVFLPEAEYVKDGLVVLGFIVEMQERGLVRPATPEDPAMERASGHNGVGRDRV